VATSHIVWNWATSTNLNFNAATDILDFGWFSADQFTISEVDGTVVIAIPSNHQTYTLQHTTLSELHLSNIVAKDASAIAEWTAALSNTPVTPPVPPVPPSLRSRRHLPSFLRAAARRRGRRAASTPPA
jgi:hypothetical protein